MCVLFFVICVCVHVCAFIDTNTHTHEFCMCPFVNSPGSKRHPHTYSTSVISIFVCFFCISIHLSSFDISLSCSKALSSFAMTRICRWMWNPLVSILCVWRRDFKFIEHFASFFVVLLPLSSFLWTLYKRWKE